MKRILQGRPVSEVVAEGALSDPRSLEPFVRMAEALAQQALTAD